MNIDTKDRSRGRTKVRYWNALLLGCTALVALAPTYAAAQQAETVLETITLDGTGSGQGDDSKTIVATQTKAGSKIAADILDTPASVSVITAKEIQQRGAQSVEQILQYTAGVTADFYGSDDRYDYFTIRGFDAYGYRDGLTIGDPFGGVREEPYAFERVEVLKGSSSTTFGVSDPGGSVNYVTKTPKRERFGEAYVTGGSFNRAETGVDFGDNITEDDTLSYRLTGKLRDSDAEFDYSKDDERFFMGGLTWRPTDATNLTVVYDHLNRDGAPGSGGHPIGTDFDRSRFFGEPDYHYDETNRNTLSVMFDHDFGNGLTFGSNARYSKSKTGFGYAYVDERVDDGNTIAERDFFGSDKSDEHFIIDGRLQYDTSFGNVDSKTLVGLEYNNRRTDSDLFYDDAPGIDWTNPIYTGPPSYAGPYESTKLKSRTTAVYLQQDLTFSDRLIASFGLRNDWIYIDRTNKLTGGVGSADLSEFTKRAGLTYKITNEFATYASYAESVSPPTVGLKPERGEQFEIGVKYRPDAFPALFTASVFDLTKYNSVVYDSNRIPNAVGEIQVRGFELEAKAEITNNLNLIAAYTYLDTEITENLGVNEGNRIGLVPEHLASLWADYTLPGNGIRGDMTFGVGARYMGSYYYSEANTGKSEDSIVFDAAFSYKVQENTSFEVNVSNVFDEKHVANAGAGGAFYNPGRAVFATLRHTW